MSVAVQSKCAACDRKEPAGPIHPFRNRPEKMMAHAIYYKDGAGRTHALKGEFMRCQNFDREMRHGAEPLGLYVFAFLPKRCRNGKTRWLTWVERHKDGTYTLGNRAR